jgi:hypothetical protein
MSKNTIKPEVQRIIKTSVNQAVKQATKVIMAANEERELSERNYFRDTEKLLYSYPALKLKVAQDEEDLASGEAFIKTEKSSDIICFSPGATRLPDDQIQQELERSRRASMERTRRQVRRIERALESIKDDQYYEIIPMKYWDNLSTEEMAVKFECEVRTVQRNKNRMVNKIKLILFGSDAL